MKSILNLVLLISLCEVSGFSFFGLGSGYMYLSRKISQIKIEDEGHYQVETKWIRQPVNHFDEASNETWQMKYYQNLRFHKDNGPLYVFVGGDGETHVNFLKVGLMFELARETHGAMFASEHRYYGEKTTHDNMEYLDSKQAVADLARLLRHLRSKYESSKIVLIGGSYAGSLAVWLKLIYPKKVDAVIASSAPLLAVQDFYQYIEQVADDYRQVAPPECWKKVKEKFKDYEEKLRYSYGINQLKEEENICPFVDMNKPENQEYFIQSQLTIFMACAVSGHSDIINSCKAFQNVTTIRSVLKNFDVKHTLWRKEVRCFDYDFMKEVNTSKDMPFIRPWMYQLCSELGWFPTATSEKNPFTKKVPPELYSLMCSVMFGKGFNERRVQNGIKYTNFVFGGLEPNVTKVLFVHGELDPWKHLGVQKKLNDETPVIIIPNASHCGDLIPNADDTDTMKNARTEIKFIIKSWIGIKDSRKLTCSQEKLLNVL